MALEPNVTAFAVRRAPKGTHPFIFAKGTHPFKFAVSCGEIIASGAQSPHNVVAVPRRRRIVFPNVPHHVTQRGNHRDRVFFEKGDPEAYLNLLHAYARRFGLAVFAYCLMPNHVHLVVVPLTADSMERALRAVHSQYAQRVNRMRKVTGHLWQGRFHSSALDTRHFLNAIRYSELNPVNARMVERAEEYAWSSAAAHCGRRTDPLLEPPQCSDLLRGITNWSHWLMNGVPDDCRERFRRNERRNLPCGSDEFVGELERSTGCDLQPRARGGQRKKPADA